MDSKTKKTSLQGQIWILFLLLAILIVGFVAFKKIQTKKIGFMLSGPAESVTANETFTIDVYLKYENEEVSAYDLQFDYDKTKVQLIEAQQGGYFKNAIEIKWDVESAWFSAAANPSGYKDGSQKIQRDKPIITLTFMSLEPTNSSVIQLKDSSEVYISQKGRFGPRNAQFTVRVQN